MRAGWIVIVLWASLAPPTTCAQTPACGGLVSGTVTLTSDLVCPEEHGLRLRSATTLDCAGHAIIGGVQPNQYGLVLEGTSDATVRNCRIEAFDVGVRLGAAVRCTLERSTVAGNRRYGVEITQASTGVRVLGNQVRDNGDEGIHVSGPSDQDGAHQLTGNTLAGNRSEGIYLLETNGNTVTGNTTEGHNGAGIYVRLSDRNQITDNVLTRDGLQLVDGSSGNRLLGNTIVGAELRLEGASGNEVAGMTIVQQDGRPANAFELVGASDNLIVDAHGGAPSGVHVSALGGSRRNRVVRFQADPSLRCLVDDTSSIVCAAPDQCHLDGACDAATATCATPARPDGAPCDDGNACTAVDSCRGGTCLGIGTPACDDRDPCTEDRCELPAGCVQRPLGGLRGVECQLGKLAAAPPCRGDELSLRLAQRIRTRIDRAREALRRAAAGRRPRRARRLRQRADRDLRAVVHLVAEATGQGVSEPCAAAIQAGVETQRLTLAALP